MKIIVALQNEIIKQNLEEIYLDNVYIYDIDTMEILLEFLSRQNEPYIIITKDSLPGNLNNKLYIKQIRLASPNSKIIYVVNKLDDEYKAFLFANEVFNIIEGNNISIEQLTNAIEQDKSVEYKTNNDSDKLNEPCLQYNVKNQIITKQLIAVYGTSGSGKSTCASLIAKTVAKDMNIKVSLLDMDVQNPSTDIINDINGNNNMLIQVVEDVDKSVEINQDSGRYLVKDKENNNLSYMTNNCSLFDCQNRLSNKYYSKIYNTIQKDFDYTVIDLPSSPFLDVVPFTLNVASIILFVINANYVSIRQAIKYLDLLTKLWDIPKSRIMLVINKISKYSLDMSQITSLIEGYEIVATINFDMSVEGGLNGVITNTLTNINLDRLYSHLGIQNSEVKKSNSSILVRTLFKKFGGVRVDNKSI